jgi:hypothetical protein
MHEESLGTVRFLRGHGANQRYGPSLSFGFITSLMLRPLARELMPHDPNVEQLPRRYLVPPPEPPKSDDGDVSAEWARAPPHPWRPLSSTVVSHRLGERENLSRGGERRDFSDGRELDPSHLVSRRLP